MRNIILDLALSLDGYIEGPDGEIDWIIFDEKVASILNSFADDIDTVIYGRKSYELWGQYKPDKPLSDDEVEFYKKIHSMQKLVVSRTLTTDSKHPNVTIISDEIAARVHSLKLQSWKEIWLYGGAKLIKTFMEENLIDIYRLTINPVILGKGKPLFSSIHRRISLSLKNVSQLENGLVTLVYTRS